MELSNPKNLATNNPLSIIIVTYNSLGDIQQCVKSILHLTAEISTIELIIVDNASTDGTAEWLQKVESAKELRIIVIYNDKNFGFTRGVNQGIALSTGRYILFLNPDVIVPAGSITTLIDCLDDSQQIGVVAPQLRYPSGAIQSSCRYLPEKRDVCMQVFAVSRLFPSSKYMNRWKMPEFDHASTRCVQQPQGACLLTTRTVLQCVGSWDERFEMFFSDVDWCRRVLQNDFEILFCATAYMYHKKGASIYKERPRMIVTSHRSFVQYFSKYDRVFWHKLATFSVYLMLLIVTVPRLLAACLHPNQRFS